MIAPQERVPRVNKTPDFYSYRNNYSSNNSPHRKNFVNCFKLRKNHPTGKNVYVKNDLLSKMLFKAYINPFKRKTKTVTISGITTPSKSVSKEPYSKKINNTFRLNYKRPKTSERKSKQSYMKANQLRTYRRNITFGGN